jgi:hypothetical protein
MAIEPVPVADEPAPEVAVVLELRAWRVLTSPLTTARPVERAATLLALVLRPVAVEVDSAVKAI